MKPAETMTRSELHETIKSYGMDWQRLTGTMMVDGAPPGALDLARRAVTMLDRGDGPDYIYEALSLSGTCDNCEAPADSWFYQESGSRYALCPHCAGAFEMGQQHPEIPLQQIDQSTWRGG